MSDPTSKSVESKSEDAQPSHASKTTSTSREAAHGSDVDTRGAETTAAPGSPGTSDPSQTTSPPPQATHGSNVDTKNAETAAACGSLDTSDPSKTPPSPTLSNHTTLTAPPKDENHNSDTSNAIDAPPGSAHPDWFEWPAPPVHQPSVKRAKESAETRKKLKSMSDEDWQAWILSLENRKFRLPF